jgi:ferredoxin
MAQIHILGSDRVISAPIGSNLLQVLQKASYPISTSCGGRASCGLCRLMVKKGKDLLSPLGENEIVHLGTVAKVIDLRLACQAVVQKDGDIEVEIPEVTDVAERKRAQTLANHEQRAKRRHGRDEEGGSGKRRRTEKIEWRPRILAKRARRNKERQRSTDK